MLAGLPTLATSASASPSTHRPATSWRRPARGRPPSLRSPSCRQPRGHRPQAACASRISGSIGGAQRGRPVVDFTLLRTSAPGIRRSQAIWCPVVPCVAGLRAALRFKGRCFGRPQNVDGHIAARFNLVACITACLLARWRAVVALDGRPRLHNAREQERRNRRRLHNKYMRAHQNGQRTCTVPQYYSIHATTI